MNTSLDAEILRLERRLERERTARKAAELVLSEKSAELYQALELGRNDRRRLELALWAGNESIWDWNAREQIYELISFPPNGSQMTRSWGAFAQVTRRIHPNDRQQFKLRWQLFLSGNLDSFDLTLRYQSPADPEQLQSLEQALAGRDKYGSDLYAEHSACPCDQDATNPAKWNWIHWRGRIVEYSEDNTPLRAVGTVKDITHYRSTQESYLLMASAFANSREAMVITDQHGLIKEANCSFLELFNTSEEAVIRVPLNRYIESTDNPRRSLDETGSITYETSSCGLQPEIPLEVSRNHFQHDNNSQHFSIITLRNLTERQRADRALQHMARHDGLTNLPNRGALHEELEKMLAQAHAERPLALMFVDLDGFKAVNDEFGHIAADLLLVTQARRMLAIIPEQGLVARWGGDEFVFCWWPPQGDLNQCRLPNMVLKAIREPMSLNTASIRLSASIGVVATTDPGTEATELIRQADAAMYEAKALGRNRIQIYCDGMSKAASHRASLLSELGHAIDQDQISFYVQPKFDAGQRICGGEMLARWTSASAGFVSPAEFIPMIEQNGLSAAFAEAVMRSGCRFASEARQLDPDIHIAINLSGWQMLDNSLPEKLLAHCQQANVPCQALELEITESVFLQPDSNPLGIMNRLRKHGFRIAIDDFGTGYSSLSYLRDMPLDTVKIDRSFVIDADANERARKILSAIIQMSHDLGMKIVAEGVETPDQLQLLQQLQVETYQGFLFARPVPFEDFLQLVRDQANAASVDH